MSKADDSKIFEFIVGGGWFKDASWMGLDHTGVGVSPITSLSRYDSPCRSMPGTFFAPTGSLKFLIRAAYRVYRLVASYS